MFGYQKLGIGQLTPGSLKARDGFGWSFEKRVAPARAGHRRMQMPGNAEKMQIPEKIAEARLRESKAVTIRAPPRRMRPSSIG
jgi:hypothetical protein